MYADFFGLQQLPFSIAPDPRYVFMSERHREALAHLLYGVEGGGGFVLLSGEIGAGKTTICRCFLEQIPPQCKVAYIFNPKLTVAELLRTVCDEFGIELLGDGRAPVTLKNCVDRLNEYLLRSHAAGEQSVLVIDEAQNLTPDVLEQLRLLTNLETTERKLLQIILIGQPELRHMLAQPELEQLAQRIIARFHLDALDENETRQYIQHRMAVAGLKGPLPFSPAALQRIHAVARGVPRRINLLCDRSLLGAYGSGSRRVERPVVDKAASEVFESVPAHSPGAPRWQPLRRMGSLALGALGGAVSAAAMVWLWAPQMVHTADAPELSKPSLSARSADGGPAAVASSRVPPAGRAELAAMLAPAEAATLPPTPGLPPGNALLRSEAAGLRELGPLWGHSLPDENPCASAARQHLRCWRTTRMTLHGLQQMDRPAVLQMQLPDGATGWALLISLDRGDAILRTGKRSWRLPVTALADTWRGGYATLWRTPKDPVRPAKENRWLTEQLSALQAVGRISADATDDRSRIQAFQRSQGLEEDGLAGPMTLMMLNRAADVAEPRLASPGS